VRFNVEVNGHVHVVEARRAGNLWRVTCNGRQLAADFTRAGDRWSLLIGPPEGGPHIPAVVGAGFRRTFSSYDVSIESRGRSERIVHLDGQSVPVSLMDPRSAFTRRSDTGGGAHAGITSIVATMPGRVVRVLVKRGESVVARQPLVVVEAMKMENEARSPRAGTVRDVRVAAGASIEAGTVMVVIE
jgi:biotin carboxyl carrier protein